VQSVDLIDIGNPDTLQIQGDIYVQDASIRGIFRVVLTNKDGLVAYVKAIPNLTANRWCHFSLNVNGQFAPGLYKIAIQQIGIDTTKLPLIVYLSDNFYLDNIQALQPTFLWEASVDGGTSWYSFRSAIGTRYSNLNFPVKGNRLKIRGSALASNSWVSSWDLTPVLGFPGQT
jgi:hypothetical protein